MELTPADDDDSADEPEAELAGWPKAGSKSVRRRCASFWRITREERSVASSEWGWWGSVRTGESGTDERERRARRARGRLDELDRRGLGLRGIHERDGQEVKEDREGRHG